MDDRSFRLGISILAVSAGALVLAAVVHSFRIPGEFWGVPVGLIAYLTTVAGRRNGRNGGDDR